MKETWDDIDRIVDVLSEISAQLEEINRSLQEIVERLVVK